MKVVTFLLDLLYPPRCAFCHDFLETSGDGLCAHCRTGLPFAQNGGRQRFSFVRACVSPLTYEGDVRASLLRYKFGGATGYAKVYGRLVAGTVRAELAGVGPRLVGAAEPQETARARVRSGASAGESDGEGARPSAHADAA